ncbi:MAG TPA: hypothetical protein VHG91_17680 [Longimicrobium sp.]|nr:hypothetical protein [Longimicrobium sp.]
MRPNESTGHGALRRLLPLLLLALPLAASAQPGASRADTLRAQVAARREEVARASERFLDRDRPAAERVRAAEEAEAFLEPEHRAGAAAVARDEREEPRVRARALLGLLHVLGEDSALVSDVAAWVASRRTPPALRDAAMTAAENLMFSHAPRPSRRELVDALRETTADPDPALRERAFAVLALQDDEVARARLLEGLGAPRSAPLPPARIVELLGASLNEGSLPALHRAMLEPPDTATRTAALRLLGGYAPSRPYLVRYLQDPREPGAVRLAAMGALHAAAPDSFPGYALPVVEDEDADEPLRVYAIRAVQYRRPSAARAQDADAFDLAVRRLAAASRSGEVRRAAADYVRRRGI